MMNKGYSQGGIPVAFSIEKLSEAECWRKYMQKGIEFQAEKKGIFFL